MRKNPESRRDFLKTTLAAGAAATLLPTPRLSAAPVASELDEITLVELQDGLKSGRFTARSLTEHYLSRMDAIDKQGPALKSVIELNPDAPAIADAMDKERAAGQVRSPLHGVPVLIKDNIGTHDRMMTTAGSLALRGSVPPQDSFVARKLREAGAVILGKTNLSEWANIRSSHSTSGWSARGGLTRNPYALDRNPCGSSSGSGVAVAANLCVVAVGTETDGSVVCPSSANGIVGIKPTLGLVSRVGIVPIAHSQDTAGPMARTVADAAALLNAMAGYDPDDPATDAMRGKPAPVYTRALDPNGLRGARIGVVRKYWGIGDEVDRICDDAITVMTRAGATVVDAELPSFGKFGEAELLVLLYELKADLNKYLASLGPGAPVHTLAEVIKFNQQHRAEEMPWFGQDLFEKAESKGPLTEKEYVDALAACRKLSRDEGIDAAMDKQRLDALVAPTAGPTWLTDLIDGDHDTGGSSNAAAVAGYPDITVPVGYVFGLPFGISFFGKAWSEPTLIRIAYAFEQATKVRKGPKFLATAELT